MRRLNVIVMVAALLAPLAARADSIKHPAGFTFPLPDIGKRWEQEIDGDLVAVNDETDKLPELRMWFFPAKETSALEAQSRAAREIAARGLKDYAGLPVENVRLGNAMRPQEVAGGEVIWMYGKANADDDVRVALVERDAKVLIAVAIPKAGIAERGFSTFHDVIFGLAPAVEKPKPAVEKSKPAASDDGALPKTSARFVAVKEVTATSTYADAKHPDRYAPWRLLAFDRVETMDDSPEQMNSAWCEGSPGDGTGEGVTITLAQPTKIDELWIASGLWKSDKLYRANNTPTAFDVTLDGATQHVGAGEPRKWTVIPVRRAVSQIGIKIAAVKKGAKYDDACLSAVELMTKKTVMTPIVGVPAAAASSVMTAIRDVQRALSARAWARAIEFPLSYNAADWFFMDGPKQPIVMKDAAAVAAACKTAEKAEARVEARSDGNSDDGDMWRSRMCPSAAGDDDDDDELFPEASAPGTVEVRFPSHREVGVVWRLAWVGGRWKLRAIDYR